MKNLAPALAREPPAFRGTDPPVQRAALAVSSPQDSAEREASDAARRVAQMPMPVRTHGAAPGIARSAATSSLQRAAAGTAPVPADTAARIQARPSGGQPLPQPLRRYMEPRFRADFSRVRLHTDDEAARLATQLRARAFTTGEHVFFGRGQFDPGSDAGRELIAHELAHTIQQGAAPRREGTVQREPEPGGGDIVLTPQPRGLLQRWGLDDILDGLAALAANVPGFTLLTLIIGRNPINLRPVERSALNLLRGFIGLIPGGEILFQVLQRYGVAERIAAWIGSQVAALGLSFQAVRDAFTRFTESLGITDIVRPDDVWRRARSIFTPLVDRITAFVGGLVTQAVAWLKEAFMAPLAAFCREIPGYGLVTVLLGRDPFTGEAVPRTALNVVRGFASFIPGGSEKVDQLVQSGALDRAYQWFQTETAARNLTWARVTGTFAGAWAALRLADVLSPIETLRRIVGLFRPLLADLVSFAGAALLKLLELIYEAAMGAGGRRILAILMRARATFVVIINNPVAFLRHLMGAVGQGVRQFMARILEHLREGVIRWLTGPVAAAGVQMPERWDLRGIIGFVLQILGLTWARVRAKLVALIGEPAMGMIERGLQLIQDIRERGLVTALRERVSEFFGSLREAALGAIRSFVQQRLVTAGVTQLLSMLNPVGAVIQAIIKTYTTIQFFIQKINQILDLVESIVNSIAAIASGAIGAAANFIERTMARTIPVILDFLARFIGLGDVGAQVTASIRGLQARVDGMLDRAVAWLRQAVGSLASRVLGGDPTAPPLERLRNGVREGTAAVNRLSGSRIGIAVIRPVLAVLRVRHQLQRLDAEARDGKWAVVGTVNPSHAELTQKLVDTTTKGAMRREYHALKASRFGTKASVKTLNAMGSKNDPSATSKDWEPLNARLFRAGAGSYYYVRGHLINGEFGGPGDDWRNLTPLTQTANNRSIASMLAKFEKPVREAVDPKKNVTADLEVAAIYTSRGRDGVASQVETDPKAIGGKARPKKEREAIAAIIRAEEFVPVAVEATATIERAGKAEKLVTRTENVIDTELTRYYHRDFPPGGGAMDRREVNLNTSTADELVAELGIDKTLAKKVVARRPPGGYRDRDHFVASFDPKPGGDAAGAEAWHRMLSAAAAKLVF
jgi:hypothetical protein